MGKKKLQIKYYNLYKCLIKYKCLVWFVNNLQNVNAFWLDNMNSVMNKLDAKWAYLVNQFSLIYWVIMLVCFQCSEAIFSSLPLSIPSSTVYRPLCCTSSPQILSSSTQKVLLTFLHSHNTQRCLDSTLSSYRWSSPRPTSSPQTT